MNKSIAHALVRPPTFGLGSKAVGQEIYTRLHDQWAWLNRRNQHPWAWGEQRRWR